ncbi:MULTISPECIES: hypothetical protein [unclassified Micromonospora]|uniref:hypothetical protein n=1 Tax=unclassified Micromonospora TaxID=2617518 RepID=UPI003A8677CB
MLAPHRRHELLDWARRTGGLIIEDGYDAEFRYDREPVGCRQGVAPDQVAYIGSVNMALVLELPAGVDDAALAVAAARPGPVLGYAAHSPGELESPVRTLAGLIGA